VPQGPGGQLARDRPIHGQLARSVGLATGALTTLQGQLVDTGTG
jgi:hypothetical protein